MIDKNELLFVVDDKSNPVEPRPRWEVHSKGYWHRVSHVWIQNSQGQLLCQKRSMLKDSNPGRWESFFGGHLAPNEEYLNKAVKETEEELGINVSKNNLIFFKIYKSERTKEFQGIYLLKWNGDISTLNFEKEEIDQLKWFDFKELKELLLNQKDQAWSEMGYEKEIFDWLEKEFEEGKNI